MLLGPTPLTWEAQVQWHQYQCGRPMMAQNSSLGTIPKTAPISEKLRRFLKMKLRGFSNVR